MYHIYVGLNLQVYNISNAMYLTRIFDRIQGSGWIKYNGIIHLFI